MHTSRLAQLAAVVAALSALLIAGPPLLIQLAVIPSLVGFPIFMLGSLLGLLALLLGLIALWATRPATGRAGRGLALGACALGAVALGLVAATAGPSAGLPPINDITTDPDDPPAFDALLSAEANAGRDMSYPGESFASQQRVGYPDLAPILVERPPAEVLEIARDAMQHFGWEVARIDAENGTIEATDTSRIFRFVDDIVVRVRPDADGARVDVRSKSREGKSDLGANAARIRQLRDALR